MTEAFYSSVMGGSKSSRGGGSSDEEGAGTKKKTKKKGKKVEVEIEEEDEEEDGEEDDKEQGLCSDIFPIYRGTNNLAFFFHNQAALTPTVLSYFHLL